MDKFYFDIGANDGRSMIDRAYEENSVVYAFEPTPQLAQKLRENYGHLSNYYIIPKAVSDYEGVSTFNISGHADWGCSSLCHFQKSDTLKRTWPGRTDFGVTQSVEVDVIRLDTFIKNLRGSGIQINQIEYFHCDAQGKDLEVLMGMGKELDIVKRGVIEMPTSHLSKLYTDQHYIHADAIEFLENRGFRIDSVDSNDAQRNEVNIHFVNVKIDT